MIERRKPNGSLVNCTGEAIEQPPVPSPQERLKCACPAWSTERGCHAARYHYRDRAQGNFVPVYCDDGCVDECECRCHERDEDEEVETP